MGGGAVWRVSTKRNAGGGGASLLLRATASRIAASMPLRVLRVLRVLRRGPMRILCCSSITSICHRLRRDILPYCPLWIYLLGLEHAAGRVLLHRFVRPLCLPPTIGRGLLGTKA